ncbi:MAG TPA: glycosyltransferase [Acidimicrobiales bacterium]|nr:glycosyltransferase [Acidimicrobiales bacterium]
MTTSVSAPTRRVVAIIPAFRSAPTIGDAIAALRSIAFVAEVVVVDDGSGDGTPDAARAAGATVIELGINRGKGGAVTAAVEATPWADVYLLVDDDVGRTATAVEALLAPVLAGDADMTIGVLPSANGRGGFGFVRDTARWGIERASGYRTQAPLSGQRAVSAPLLRSLLPLAPRFGLETGLTIDAARQGARVVEVGVEMDHHHRGRSISGFAHRAHQGGDVVRALWTRLTTSRARIALLVAALVASLGVMAWTGSAWEPKNVPLQAGAAAGAAGRQKVVLFGMDHVGFEDFGRGNTPNLDRIASEGAVASTSIRTLSRKSSTGEGYASLGASARIAADDRSVLAYDADTRVQGGTAAELVTRLTGHQASGEVVVTGVASTRKLVAGLHLSSGAGALGDALHKAGLRTAAVGNADNPGSLDPMVPRIVRPAPLAVMDRNGAVDTGAVNPADVLLADPSAPFGVRADPDKMLAQAKRALDAADVVVVDPGDLDRAEAFRRNALDAPAQAARLRALVATDTLLGQVADALPPNTLLIVTSVSAPSGHWHLVPTVIRGRGVTHSYLHSPSTKRLGVVTITDLGPTILDTLHRPVADGMIGHALRRHAGTPSLTYFRHLDRDTTYRESSYYPLALGYIVGQALLYAFCILALSRRFGSVGARSLARLLVLAVAGFPLATFVLRMIPNFAALGQTNTLVLLVIDTVIVALALRARRHPLSPLSWILGITVALLVVDTATGSRLEISSWLGYSLHTAGRFYGMPNTTFAVLATSALLWACIHVHYAPRRREALVTAGVVLALVTVVDALPGLGDDVGGVLTLVPVFGLTMLVLARVRLSWKTIGIVVGATAALLVVGSTIDLLRPPEARTHLGRFVASLFKDGPGVLTTTIARKEAANIRILKASIWTWVLPIASVFLLYLLVWQGLFRQLLPPRSALRTSAVAALALGLVGFATNDSGPVLVALVFSYVGPFMTLRAQEVQAQSPPAFPPRVAAVATP